MRDDSVAMKESKNNVVSQNGVKRLERPDLIEIDESVNHLEIDPTLKKIAETNKVEISWEQLQPILIDLLTKQNNLMEDKLKDENLKKAVHDLFVKIVHSINEHLGCPFTIQRLCELIIDPRKFYKMYIKYLRAVEKILQVTSYWEDYVYDMEGEDTIMEGASSTATPATNGSLLFNKADGLELEPHNFERGEMDMEEEHGPSTTTSTAAIAIPGEKRKDKEDVKGTEETTQSDEANSIGVGKKVIKEEDEDEDEDDDEDEQKAKDAKRAKKESVPEATNDAEPPKQKMRRQK